MISFNGKYILPIQNHLYGEINSRIAIQNFAFRSHTIGCQQNPDNILTDITAYSGGSGEITAGALPSSNTFLSTILSLLPVILIISFYI